MTLIRWLSWRQARTQPGRTLLALLGVAVGVATFVSIQVASESVLGAFRATVESLVGRTSLQVRGDSGGFDERIILRVRKVPGVRAAAPVVQT